MNDGNGSGILQQAPGSCSGLQALHLPGYVSGENMDIEYWGGGRVGRTRTKKLHGHDCIQALVSTADYLNQYLVGHFLIIRFPSQLYVEKNCMAHFWQYQELFNFLDFSMRKEKKGILNQVILHLTKISE